MVFFHPKNVVLRRGLIIKFRQSLADKTICWAKVTVCFWENLITISYLEFKPSKLSFSFEQIWMFLSYRMTVQTDRKWCWGICWSPRLSDYSPGYWDSAPAPPSEPESWRMRWDISGRAGSGSSQHCRLVLAWLAGPTERLRLRRERSGEPGSISDTTSSSLHSAVSIGN